MISTENFIFIAMVWAGLAIPVFIMLQFIIAPFGRHTKKGFGKMINNQLAWVIMESVSFITVVTLFISGIQPKSYVSWGIVLLWLAHYVNRAFIYPLRQKNKKEVMPLAICIAAVFFNLFNGGLNGYYLGWIGNYNASVFYTWNFWVGIVLFFAGAIINIKSDNMLLGLRKPGDTGYKVPKGFLFKYISCPNHFGEIIEWIGFALITWNWASLSFAIWTFANLAPRAIAHHRWYKSNFENYPKNRHALIPYFW